MNTPLRSDTNRVAGSEPFVRCSAVELEDVAPGIQRQLLGYGPDIMGARVVFTEGAVGEAHTHPHSQMSYVESGVFEVTVNGVTETLRAGDSFYVAPYLLHGALCKEDGVLIDVFSPLREDFLENETGQ